MVISGLRATDLGEYSVRVNEQWRICFVRREGDAREIEIVDDHAGLH